MADDEYSGEIFSEDDELADLRRKKLENYEKRLFQKENTGVTAVNDISFPEFVKVSRNAVVDVWAEWCGPCRRVAPVIEELSEEFTGQVSFAKCNSDESPGVSGRFMITAIPTLLFFSGGQLCDRLTGAYPKENIRQRIISAFQL